MVLLQLWDHGTMRSCVVLSLLFVGFHNRYEISPEIFVQPLFDPRSRLTFTPACERENFCLKEFRRSALKAVGVAGRIWSTLVTTFWSYFSKLKSSIIFPSLPETTRKPILVSILSAATQQSPPIMDKRWIAAATRDSACGPSRGCELVLRDASNPMPMSIEHPNQTGTNGAVRHPILQCFLTRVICTTKYVYILTVETEVTYPADPVWYPVCKWLLELFRRLSSAKDSQKSRRKPALSNQRFWWAHGDLYPVRSQ